MNTEALHRQVDAIIDWVVETRRALHQHPELGMEEHQTAEKIAAALAEIGIPYTPGVAGTGIIGIITSGAPGKTVALRADMDALPIQEQTGLAYASRIPGKMHACGHDIHTVTLLGAAEVGGLGAGLATCAPPAGADAGASAAPKVKSETEGRTSSPDPLSAGTGERSSAASGFSRRANALSALNALSAGAKKGRSSRE